MYRVFSHLFNENSQITCSAQVIHLPSETQEYAFCSLIYYYYHIFSEPLRAIKTQYIFWMRERFSHCVRASHEHNDRSNRFAERRVNFAGSGAIGINSLRRMMPNTVFRKRLDSNDTQKITWTISQFYKYPSSAISYQFFFIKVTHSIV